MSEWRLYAGVSACRWRAVREGRTAMCSAKGGWRRSMRMFSPTINVRNQLGICVVFVLCGGSSRQAESANYISSVPPPTHAREQL